MGCTLFIRVMIPFLCCLLLAEDDWLTVEERAWLDNHQEPLVVAVEYNYPPFVFTDENGNPAGISMDYVAEMEALLGVRFQRSEPGNLSSVLVRVQEGEIDFVTSVVSNTKRAEFLNFTKPYITVPLRIIVKQTVKGDMSLSDLQGKRVAVAVDYAAHDYLKGLAGELVLVPVHDDEEGLYKVSFGEVDAFVADVATAGYLMNRNSLSNLRVAGGLDYEYRLCFAASVDHPLLAGILQKAFDRIPANKRGAVFHKWVGLRESPFYQRPMFRVVVVSLLLLFFLTVVWIRVLRGVVAQRTLALKAEVAEHQRTEDALRAAHDHLELRVMERTAELDERNDRLRAEISKRRLVEQQLRVSKEIANGTVHNIRNVVNSVLFSARDISAEVENSKLHLLVKLADLVREQGADFPRFLAEDERGKMVPDLILLLADSFRDFDEAVRSELEELKARIELISEAAGSQQAFAVDRGGPTPLPDIIENALAIQLTQAASESLELVRDIQYREVLPQPRATLAHILLNLIKNGLEAMRGRIEKRLLIRARQVGDLVEISVSDNGVGIDPEVMPRLFTHGFTTKQDGHGFGLHFCRNVALEIGGDLRAESEGEGKGSTFTLSLPLVVDEASLVTEHGGDHFQ